MKTEPLPKIIFLFLCIFFTRGTAVADTGSLDLRLEIYQSLRAGIQGIRMDNEYVRIGIPFPQGMVKEINGRALISVEGADFQSRVLKKWADGSVKWALVEFLASVKEGSKTEVVVGEGNGVSSNKFLGSEKDGVIRIDTEKMKLEIKKKGFNIFNRVMVDGKEFVQDGASRGIVLVDGEGKEFTVAQCKDTKVIIEENGPVKAAVKVEGSHCNGESRLLDYTMRLFFYKGKSRVKVQYTLMNASMGSVKHAFIRSLNLETKIKFDDTKVIAVPTHKGLKDVELQKGDVVFYQAVSDFPWLSDGNSFYYHGPVPPDYERERQRGYKQEGYRIWQDKTLLFKGDRKEYSDLGFINISDSSGSGMTVGIRYMAGYWPKALKADISGNVNVSLWPEENEVGYWIRYGSHNTFEVMYSFQPDSSEKPEDEMKKFQYPLIARAPVEWYNMNAEGIYPLYHFISFNDEKKLADKLNIKYRLGDRKVKFKVWRYHYWGHGAFLNQHDFARIAMINSLRDDRELTRSGESYLFAEAVFNYYADWAVYHSDDYDYSKIQYPLKENNSQPELAKVVFEWEHQHWYGMPLYYYMTGDERIKEAIIDLGEYIKKLANPLSLTYMRVVGTGMFSLAAMYEFTGDEEFLKLADMNFQNLLNSKYDPNKPYQNIFIDWERGCVIGGSGSGWNPGNPGIKADLMLGSILYDGLLNYYYFIKNDNPLKEKVYGLLMKISEFMYREPYFEGAKKGEWAFWIPYVYNLADREKSKHGYKLIGQASFWVVMPYIFTGESRWFERMEKMAKMAVWDEDGKWGGFSFIDHPGYQTMAYFILKDYKHE